MAALGRPFYFLGRIGSIVQRPRYQTDTTVCVEMKTVELCFKIVRPVNDRDTPYGVHRPH